METSLAMERRLESVSSPDQPVDLRTENLASLIPKAKLEEVIKDKLEQELKNAKEEELEKEDEYQCFIKRRRERLYSPLSRSNSETTGHSSREVKKRRLNALLHKKFRPESKLVSNESNVESNLEENKEEQVENLERLRARRVQELQAILASSSPKERHEQEQEEVRHQDQQGQQGQQEVRQQEVRQQEVRQPPKLKSIQSLVNEIRRPLPMSSMNMRDELSSNMSESLSTPTKSSSLSMEENLKTQLLQLHLAQMAAFNSLVVSPSQLLRNLDSETQKKTLLQQYGYFSLLLKRIQGLQQELLEKLMNCCHQRKIENEDNENQKRQQQVKERDESNKVISNRVQGEVNKRRPDISVFQWHPSKSVKECLMRSPPMARPKSASLSESSEPLTQPRKRAPRAMTGRYVRTGPGASKEILAALRRKVLRQQQQQRVL